VAATGSDRIATTKHAVVHNSVAGSALDRLVGLFTSIPLTPIVCPSCYNTICLMARLDHAALQHAMIVDRAPFVTETMHAQSGGDCPPASRQQGADH
jgi:hypothetical protein